VGFAKLVLLLFAGGKPHSFTRKAKYKLLEIISKNDLAKS